MERYPGTGTIFVHVIPEGWGPFVDIRAMYQSLARRRPWTHVISPREYADRMNTWLWNDPDTVFICWSMMDPGPKWQRKSTVLQVYSEALDDDGRVLLPDHLKYWHAFKTMSVHFDAALTHTPMTCMIVDRVIPTFVMPVGWDEGAMGRPRPDAPKHRTYVYHGSTAGRREMLVPYVTKALGKLFCDATGSFGRGLLGIIDTSLASLYIAHSEVASFSTWRLWQVASTTAAMVAEPGDTWPFESDRHLVTIPRINTTNGKSVMRRLEEISQERDLLARISGQAHEEVARRYTVDYIEDHFLVPAVETLRRKR